MKKYRWDRLIQEYHEGGYQDIRQFARDKEYQDSPYFCRKMKEKLEVQPQTLEQKAPSPAPSSLGADRQQPNRIQEIWDNLLRIIDQGSQNAELSTHEAYEMARALDHIQKAMTQAPKNTEEESVAKLIEAIDQATQKLS